MGLAILLGDQNRIVLRDEGTKSVNEVYKLTDRGEAIYIVYELSSKFESVQFC